MTKSCLVWFANCTDISNASHSGLTTGSFWSSAVASECFSPESAECFSISSLLSLVSASCSLKGKKKSLEEGEGKTVGVQDLTCLEFQQVFLVWQGAHLNRPGFGVWWDGVWSSFANALFKGRAAVTVQGGTSERTSPSVETNWIIAGRQNTQYFLRPHAEEERVEEVLFVKRIKKLDENESSWVYS